MTQRSTRAIKTIAKWGIAIAGIAWVTSNISFRDTILVLNQYNIPQREIVIEREDNGSFVTLSQDSHTTRKVNSDQVVFPPHQPYVTRISPSEKSSQRLELLGVRQKNGPNAKQLDFLVRDPVTKAGQWVESFETLENGTRFREDNITQPGVLSLGKQARWSYISLAFALFPITYLLVSLRWLMLLRAIGIQMTMGRAITLSALGSFYNTFLPGSNGGDIVRAYQAGRETQQPVAATVSVVLDRVVGLLSLVVLASFSSAVVMTTGNKNDAAFRECAHIFWTCTLISAAFLALFLVAQKVPIELLARRFASMSWLRISGLPSLRQRMQPVLVKAKEFIRVVDLYRRLPKTLILALVSAIPAHLILTACAIALAVAFNLKVPSGYFLVVVPILVLVGAIPLSPQGVGVQEVVAAMLLDSYAVPMSQVLAFTMSLRLIQVSWYLIGGLVVTNINRGSLTDKPANLQTMQLAV